LSSLIGSSPSPPADDREYQHVTGLPPLPAEKRPIAVPGPTGGEGPSRIPISQIGPNPYQPRRDFNEQDLDELAASIRRQGLLQPLVVCPDIGPDAPTPYLLVAGERRLRAARKAGLEAVDCVVRSATRDQMLEFALVENIHRRDLNPVERAAAYRQFVERLALTHEEAAERLSQPRATVSNYLRIMDLQEETQALIAGGALSFGHAKVLGALVEEPARQVALAHRVAAEGLSVRQLERLVTGPGGAAPSGPGAVKPPYLRDLEGQLSQAVGTRVTIQPARAKDSGRVVIEYCSLDEFDRIAALLGAKLES